MSKILLGPTPSIYPMPTLLMEQMWTANQTSWLLPGVVLPVAHPDDFGSHTTFPVYPDWHQAKYGVFH